MGNQERSRGFDIITYGCDLDFIRRVACAHSAQCWAIIHDDEDDLKIDDGGGDGPHLHVVIQTKNGHSFSAIRKWFAHEFEGRQQTVRVQELSSLRGAIRYLCHLDDPDKKMYGADSVLVVGGDPAKRIFDDSMSENGSEDRQIKIIMAYVRREISLYDAMTFAPEIFVHKYSSIQRLVKDLRNEIYNEGEQENVG